MKTARALITHRRRRAAALEDRFIYRLQRLDRNRSALAPRLGVFRNQPSRRAA